MFCFHSFKTASFLREHKAFLLNSRNSAYTHHVLVGELSNHIMSYFSTYSINVSLLNDTSDHLQTVASMYISQTFLYTSRVPDIEMSTCLWETHSLDVRLNAWALKCIPHFQSSGYVRQPLSVWRWFTRSFLPALIDGWKCFWSFVTLNLSLWMHSVNVIVLRNNGIAYKHNIMVI